MLISSLTIPLIYSLIARDIESRYRGTSVGFTWLILQPILLLTIYSFVFQYVFGARWLDSSGEKDFVLVLFLGLVLHSFFAEIISRSPTLILSNTSLVKKVVFPTEILSVVLVCVSFCLLLLALLIWSCLFVAKGYKPELTAFYFPLVLFPLLLTALGWSWILAAIGVYLRDLDQIMGFLSTALLFLSPIFYSIESLPHPLQKLLYLNPLTLVVIESRQVLIFGVAPDWSHLMISYFSALVFLLLGMAIYRKLRKGFSDVL